MSNFRRAELNSYFSRLKQLLTAFNSTLCLYARQPGRVLKKLNAAFSHSLRSNSHRLNTRQSDRRLESQKAYYKPKNTYLPRLFSQSNNEDIALSFSNLILKNLQPLQAELSTQLESRKAGSSNFTIFLGIPLKIFYPCLELESNRKSTAFHNRKQVSRNHSRFRVQRLTHGHGSPCLNARQSDLLRGFSQKVAPQLP